MAEQLWGEHPGPGPGSPREEEPAPSGQCQPEPRARRGPGCASSDSPSTDPSTDLFSTDFPGLTGSQGIAASPAQHPQCPRLSPPNHRLLRLIVMYNLLTSGTTLVSFLCSEAMEQQLWQAKGAPAARAGQFWLDTALPCPSPCFHPIPTLQSPLPALPALISPLLPGRHRLLSQLPASPSSLSPFSFVFHF